MATVHLGIASGSDLANAISGLGSSLDQLTTRQRANTAATRQQTAASNQATTGLAGFAQQAQQGVQRVQSVASAVQRLTTMMGSRNGTAGLVASVAGTTAEFASMGSMLGPGGTVIGGIAGLVAGLVSTREAANDARISAERATTSFEEMGRAMREAGAARSRYAAAAGDGLVEGAPLGLEEVGDMLAGAEEAHRLARNRTVLAFGANDADAYREAREEARRLEGEIANLRETYDELRDAASRVAEIPVGADVPTDPHFMDPPGAGGRGGRGGPTAEELAAIYDQWDAEREAAYADAEADAKRHASEEERIVREKLDYIHELEEVARQREREEDEADWNAWVDARRDSLERALDASRESAEAHRDLLAASSDAYADFAASSRSSIDQIVDAWHEYNDAAKAAGVQTLSVGRLMTQGMTATGNRISDVLGNQVTGAFNQALGAWLDGSKSFVEAAEEMAKGVIKALVQESIVQGVTELARGIADLASYRYDSAALHFAAAAAWAVVGGVAGGIGAATGAFGGGGQGAGASSRDTADSQRDRERDQGAGTQVVNIYMDGMHLTQSDVARGMGRVFRSAQRHGELPRFARAA